MKKRQGNHPGNTRVYKGTFIVCKVLGEQLIPRSGFMSRNAAIKEATAKALENPGNSYEIITRDKAYPWEYDLDLNRNITYDDESEES